MKTMYLKKIKYAELAVIVLLAGALAGVVLHNFYDDQERDRDAVRIADISTIRAALAQYKADHDSYPPCLYKTQNCTSLEGSSAMNRVPTDPLTGLGYGYAALGSGESCVSYHLGISLERTASQALLTGSDAPPEAASALCTGSAPDFSGLSYAPGGHPCDEAVGVAQPTDDPHGETCYDVKPRR
jgi:type II secretory pathway pseudopilin PulG